MKYIPRLTYLSTILVLLIFQCTTDIYSSNYYVDGDLKTGNNNGSSWENAWQSFSAINWNLIQPGDVVYISGGSDSTIYYENLDINASGSWKKYIFVMAGKYSPNPEGHSGRVVIDGQRVRNQILNITSQHWVYVKGLEVRHGTSNWAGIRLYLSASHIVIDSCYSYEHYGAHLVMIGAVSGSVYDISNIDSTGLINNIEIKNCVMYSLKDYPGGNSDDIIMMNCTRDININNNYLHMRNIQSGTPVGSHKHIDPIQSVSSAGLKVWNNVVIVDSGAYGHCMILGQQSRPGGLDTNIIYNNFMYEGGHLNPGGNPSVPQLYLRWYGFGNSVYPPTFVYHNTIVAANGGSWAIFHERPAIVKNNILITTGTNGKSPSLFGGVGREVWFGSYGTDFYTYADSCTNNLVSSNYGGDLFGGNRFMGRGGYPVGTPNGWSGWVNLYGGNGVNANPEFVNNVRGRNGYVISSTSPARNLGSNLKDFIESKGLPWTDIDGKPRDSSPDLGAYEYTENHGNLDPKNYSYELSQNYPNPFNPSTSIEYYTPEVSSVKLVVYNSVGEEVQTLVDDHEAIGLHEVDFNAANLPSGVYFYRLLATNFSITRKMVLLR